MADINDLKDICISSGTLRAEDLLPRFMGILKDYAPEKFNEFIKGYPELDGWEDYLEADWRIISDDTKMNASDELFGLLNDIAPEGTMFSSTEGDGSDFGFWSMSNESKKNETNSPEEEAVKKVLMDASADAEFRREAGKDFSAEDFEKSIDANIEKLRDVFLEVLYFDDGSFKCDVNDHEETRDLCSFVASKVAYILGLPDSVATAIDGYLLWYVAQENIVSDESKKSEDTLTNEKLARGYNITSKLINTALDYGYDYYDGMVATPEEHNKLFNTLMDYFAKQPSSIQKGSNDQVLSLLKAKLKEILDSRKNEYPNSESKKSEKVLKPDEDFTITSPFRKVKHSREFNDYRSEVSYEMSKIFDRTGMTDSARDKYYYALTKNYDLIEKLRELWNTDVEEDVAAREAIKFIDSIQEKLLDDDEGEKALKQMAKDGKSTGEVAADIRYDVATALDMAADKAEDLMSKFGLDKIYVLRAKGLSPKAIVSPRPRPRCVPGGLTSRRTSRSV